MNHVRANDATLSLAALEQIDQACLEFEAAWRAGGRPSIEPCLAGWQGLEQAALLCQLLLLEIDYRRQQGEQPAIEEYRTRFPDSLPAVETAFREETPAADGGLPPGTKVRYFGDYEILEEIGRGGMGVVYRARQRKLHRVVALKMIRAGHLASKEEVERFHREAQAAAHLDHPGIVPIFEVGEHEGQHYYSMGYVSGRSLAARMAEGPMEPRDAAVLVASAAEAIQYSHERQVYHRDLKPSNILLDSGGKPRIIDFGLAKRAAADSELTAASQVVGTPSYMPPEQAAGGGDAIGPATDIYGLGAVLYALLTGRPPFLAANPSATLSQVLHQEPVSPRQLNPHVPRDLETITLKCLQKEPPRRYAAAQELADELGRYLAGVPIRARPVGRGERLWRWCKRQPKLAALTGSVVLLLVLIAGGSTLAAILLHEETRIAVRNLDRAVQAESDAEERLWMAYLAQAHAGRWSGRIGQRFEGLDALAKAAAIRPAPELRDEAIACMALPDLRLVKQWTQEPGTIKQTYLDPTLQRYCVNNANGDLAFRRVEDRSEVAFVRGPGREVDFLRWSHEGKFIAVRYGGGTLTRIYQVDGAKLAFQVPVEMVHGALDFSADGRHVATGGPDGSIYLYETASGKEVGRLGPGPQPLNLALHPNGGSTAVGTQAGVVQVRSWRSKEIVEFPHPGTIASVAWAPDGKRLAAGCTDFRAYVWDMSTSKPAAPTAVLEGHTAEVAYLHFNHAGDVLATVGWDGMSRFWDPAGGQLLLSVPGVCWGFSAEDRSVGIVSGTVAGIWEMAAGRECRTFHESLIGYKGPRSVNLGPDGSFVASVGEHDVRLWQLAQGNMAAQVRRPWCGWAAFHPADGSLLTQSLSGLERWPVKADPSSGVLRIGPPAVLRAQAGGNMDIGGSLSPGGRFLGVVASPGMIAVRDLEKRSAEVLLPGRSDSPSIAVSPDGRWVATGGWHEFGIRVLEASSAKLVRTVHPEAVSLRAAFSPDGRWLVTSTVEGYQVWEAGTWRANRFIARKQEGLPPPLAFCPKGTLLAITSSRDTVQLIDTATWSALATLQSPVSRSVNCLDFSRDGSQLAVGGDRITQVWDLREVRRQLAEMGLDWDLPPYPPAPPPPSKPLRVEVVSERGPDGEPAGGIRAIKAARIKSK